MSENKNRFYKISAYIYGVSKVVRIEENKNLLWGYNTLVHQIYITSMASGFSGSENRYIRIELWSGTTYSPLYWQSEISEHPVFRHPEIKPVADRE